MRTSSTHVVNGLRLASTAIAIACGLSTGVVVRAQSFSEDFSQWPISARGWVTINNSSPLPTGSTLAGWYQGRPFLFPAQAGPEASYAMSGYDSAATSGGAVSAWLISPPITLINGVAITFWTRQDIDNSPPELVFPNQMELRLNPTGSTNVGSTPTSVGDFTILLTRVNPTLSAGGYPQVWTSFTVVVSGLNGPTTCRLAFRNLLPNNLTQGSFIGIDTLTIGQCYPNCDGSTTSPVLGPSDFSCFLSRYRSGDPYANCDASTVAPVLGPVDFSCFLSKYRAGC